MSETVLPEEARQVALNDLIEQNKWRGGLSQGEQTCFEAGWDAALEFERLQFEQEQSK